MKDLIKMELLSVSDRSVVSVLLGAPSISNRIY